MTAAPKPPPTCRKCGAPMVYETRELVVEYDGHSTPVKIPGWWCTQCQDQRPTGKAATLYRRAHATFKAQADDLLTPEEVTRIREKLNLSQRAASRLLGGGAHGFHQYESGERSAKLALSQLLRLLDAHPHLLRELKPPTRETDDE